MFNLGSASVHHHIISESSSKLFQRAILASGAALNPWAITDENHFNRAKQFGTHEINLIFQLNYI